DSEEDDIFSAAPRKSEPKTTATKSSDLLTVPSQAPSKQKPTGGVSVFPSLDRSPALSATAVKTTEVIDPLADKRDEAIVDVRKAVEVDEKDERSSTGPSSAASSSSPVPVAAEKQLIPSDPSDNGPVSEVKQPSKPIGGVSVLPPLPTQSVRQENPVVVNKISEEKIKEDAATTDIHEPPALPSQPTEERTSPKSTPFALDDDSDDEDLFSPKGSTNSTPTANARENLANIMVAGLKKNIAQATAPSNPARIAPSSSAVDEPRDNDTTDQHRPLESLAKTRAKIPTSSRRPPSRRPFSPPQSSLFESDSDDDRVESASAPAQPATAAVASPVSLRPEPPIQPPVSVPNHEATPSSVGSNSAQSAKPPAAASMKSPLFGSDSDNDEGDSKPPPAASKTAATTATESPSNKPAQVTTPLPQANNKPVHADGTPVQAGGTPVQASASPAPQVEKEEPKLAPKAAAPAKAPARPAATALFDSDDDEDIFAPAPAKAAPAASSAPAKPPVKSATTATPSTAPAPLFADDDIDDIFAVNKPSNPAKAPVEPSKTSVPVKKTAPTAKSGALFGDDSDSDLDIFK
uniref:FAM21/CAPZIP domain-containing protein n=1 Tax=Plectus sambesii TaxID=2011161 RepID=A0A914X0I0_9BILA